MEANGIGVGIYTSLLGLENNNNLQQHQMVYATHHDTESHPSQQQQQQQGMKHGYNYSSKKPQSSNFSDEDEPGAGGGFGADESSGDPKRKASPWHRMKWTDAMVRLLIMAVYYIGDEVGSEGVGGGGGGGDPGGKKKNSGLLQKKGKWKSVSRAMMEKGFYVSPQQCEDKFNDLNKRYKRVNDILGRGTACRVVENQSLLETMDLSPKMKEEVRKLLNSKHLFFREMCAYHNSCAHGAAAAASGGNAPHSAEVGTEQPLQIQQPQPHHPPQQRCFHSSVNGVGMLKDDDDDEEEDESEDSSDEDEEESGEGGGSRGQVEDDENDVVRSRKRQRNNKGGFCVTSSAQLMQQLNSEVAGVLQDGGKNPWEKKQWIKKRVLQLEEQQVRYQVEAFELEKQRLKWVRFSSKKERDMERDKLENERRRLENERLLLLLRQKELEFISLHHLKHQHQQQQQHSST
ncbi:hypothetical protein PIB30_062308 [Stylosanthes scabra]|uniref:Myb/SANT-like DNA-binding domain-containing protein n=1 Tax=Stylosanthes scabra TaxID=79078 RepID=A0ABU6YLD0_9FABA|nr:hypothetical protein [Stylosanthes scabra]